MSTKKTAKTTRKPSHTPVSISQEEYNRRAVLHDRFTEEIKSLAGKQVHLVSFVIGTDWFAIEIGKVNEVVKSPAVTKLPKTPPYIPGVGNVRGTNIIMLDLAAKLGLDEGVSLNERNAYTIVVSSDRFTIGILVPEVPLSRKVSGEDIQPTGLDLAGTPEDETYIKGLIDTGEDHIFFIDIDELIEGDRMGARVSQNVKEH